MKLGRGRGLWSKGGWWRFGQSCWASRQACGRVLWELVRGLKRPLYLGRSGRRQIVVLASNWTIVDMLMRRLGCW